MDIITLIIQGVTLTSQIVIFMYLLKIRKNINNLYEDYTNNSPQRSIQKLEENKLMNDIVEYALNSDLECMVMPNEQDQTTLFVRSKKDNILPVCIIPFIEYEKESKDYQNILTSIKGEVDTFIKNNPQYLEKNNA
jgi:hypothetical protein